MKSSKKIAFAAAALMLASLIGSTVSAGDYPEDKNLGDPGSSDYSTVGGTTGGGTVHSPERDGIIDSPDVTPDFVVKVPGDGVSFTPAAIRKMARTDKLYTYAFPNGSKIRIDGSKIKVKEASQINIVITPDKKNNQVIVEVLGNVEEFGYAVEVYVPKKALEIAGVDSQSANLYDGEGNDLGSCASKSKRIGVWFETAKPGTFVIK